ncbi:MAG: HlyC/CorC family transporter [Planctomycetes bacterium]|nr:HlyC/CorC family transporter [Planctomycetota bacterium]
MILALWIILVLSVLFASWLAAIERALLMSSQVGLRHEMEVRGMPNRAMWLSSQYEAVTQSVAFARGVCFLLVIAAVTGLLGGFDSVAYMIIVSALAISGGVLWIFASVVGGAIAAAVPAGTVCRSWWLIRLSMILGGLARVPIAVIGEIVRRLTGANLVQQNGSTDVEDQLLKSIEHSQREGGIPAEAAEMLENVVEFRTTDVGEIMTPRTDVEGVEHTDDLNEIRKFVLESGRSRIPVYKENIDHILGILYVKDLVAFFGAKDEGFNLLSILRQPIVVPDTKPVQELLGDFQRSEVHMAVVIDEYGGTAGIVTIEDVIEEIVGEIRDEHDDAQADEPKLVKVSEGLVEVDGRYNLDDLNDELSWELPEDEEYDTLAGFVLAHLGHVPQVGEVLETHEMRFTTLEASATQINRLSIAYTLHEE